MRSSFQSFRTTFFGRRAISLTELIIAGGIGLALVAGGLYFGTRFNQTTSLEATKQELNHKMNLAARQFEMDFSNAIKIKGSSKLSPAVFTLGSAGPNGDELSPRIALRSSLSINDIIVMFLAHAKEFSAPLFEITQITCPDASSGKGVSNELIRAAVRIPMEAKARPTDCYQAKIPVSKVNAQALGAGSSSPEIIHQFNAQQFLNKALEQTDLFLASNLRYSFLIKKVSYDQPTGTEHRGVLTFKIWFIGNKEAPIDFSFLRLQAVKRVIYQVDSANNLMRKVSGFTDGLNLEQKLLENVLKFQVDYFFADRRSVVFGADIDESGQIIPLRIPSEPLSAPDFDDEPELAWTDISAAKLSLEVLSKKAFEEKTTSGSAIADTHCKWVKVYLSCEKNFVTAGADFESLLVDSQSSSSGEGCLPGDVQSRCNSDCDHVYVSSQRTALNWEGYKTGSDYCACKGSSDIFPEEAGFDKPDFSGIRRLNACIRAMASCSQASGSWAQHDPRLYVACYGVKPDFHDDLLKFDANGNFDASGTPWAESGELNDEWDAFTTALSSLATEAPPSPPTYEDLTGASDVSKRKLSCLDWPEVNRKAAAWSPASDGSSGYENSYLNLCGCRLYEFDDEGAPSAEKINRYKYHWPTLCECPNLYEVDGSDRRYKVRASSTANNVDAFYRYDQATLCQCKQEDSSNDFRRGDTFGRPPGTYFQGLASDSKEATIGSLYVDVKIDNLGSSPSQNQEFTYQRCTSAQMWNNSYEWRLDGSSIPINKGGCAEPFDGEGTHNNELVLANFVPYGAVSGATEGPVWQNTSWPTDHPTQRHEWSGYCRFVCGEHGTRNRLLNRDPATIGSWPLWCGAGGQGSSSGEGVESE